MKVGLQLCGVVLLAASSAVALDKEIAGKLVEASPMSARGKADWAWLKAEDGKKSRAHAGGVALRAGKLRQTAAGLEQS